MITLNQVHERLAEAIKESGKTQVELAKSVGVSQLTISHYLKGTKMPALDTFANLCKILDADTDYILCQND